MRLHDNQVVLELLILMVCFVMFSGFHWWDPVARWMGIGNEAVKNGEISSAAEAYEKASKVEPGNERVLYNKALANLLQEKPEEALKQLETAVGSNDLEVRTRAFYNKGCVELQSNDPAAAAESFTESLKLNPEDEDAKVNLEIALQILQQMPTPSPQPQENQENQDGEDQQDDQNNQPTPTPSGTGSPEPESQQQPEESSPTPQPSPSPVEEGKMTQQEAERLLDAQEEDEMEVLRRLHQLPMVRDREIEKDW
ncbi:tetratricopeptide repeat protein [bacterium]|nr:tetratricopeptide repeat protein [bacterium]